MVLFVAAMPNQALVVYSEEAVLRLARKEGDVSEGTHGVVPHGQKVPDLAGA